MNLIKLTQTFRRGLTALLVGALLASCGGGGGGSGSPSTSTSVTATSTITAAGGSVNINGKTVVELSADATTQAAIVTVETRPSTAAGITDEVVLDLGGAIPSTTAPSEISVYFYPQTVQAGLMSFTLPGSTTSYTLDQIVAVGKVGADLALRGRLEYDVAKGAIKAVFSLAGYGVQAVGNGAKFVVNLHDSILDANEDNTVRLYRFDFLTSTWTEVASNDELNGKIPLVLVHGIQLFWESCGKNSAYRDTWHEQDQTKDKRLLNNFFATPELAQKYVVYSLSYPTNLHFKDNGKSFSQKLSQAFGNRPVVVVAHSMGGLVTRAADVYSAKGEIGFASGINIARVITLNTPHHGTPYSDNGGTLSEMLCMGNSAVTKGGNSLAWDGIDTGGNCTNDVLCDLNAPGNAAHLKKYVPYSTYSIAGATATLADPREWAFSLMIASANPVLMGVAFPATVLNNYFSDAVAKKSDGVVLVPSQRLMSFIGGAWQDKPSLFASLPDAYAGIWHLGVHKDPKVWAQKANGSPGGIKQDLLNFYAEISALTAPTVTLTASPSSIANGATGVAVNSAISVIFSEALNASTITTSTFTLNGPGGLVAGTVTYNPTTNTATFTPSAALAYSTAYTATITTGAKDLAGNPLASNYSWSFTTGGGAPAPAAGSLDTSFNGTGKVTTDIGASIGRPDAANAVAIQPDGRIVAAGYSVGGNYDFAVVRYHADGSLDAGFGTAGKVTTDIAGDDIANAVAIQPDGRIVVAGWSSSLGGSLNFAVVRYHADGSLDASFGTAGKVTTAIGAGSGNDGAKAVAIQPDGRIVVAGGYSFIGDFAVVRYHADGSLDASFGTAGKVTTDIAGYYGDVATAVAIQPDGRIVAAGSSVIGGRYAFAVVRYHANGSLDASFGAAGKVTTAIGAGSSSYNNGAAAVAIQPDGRIVAAGRSSVGGSPDFAVVRYHANGSLDASFGTAGKVTTDIGAGDDAAKAVAIQSDGRIVVAGDSYIGNYDFAVVRYHADGSLDASFGAAGKVTTNISAVAGHDGVAAVAIQPDGRIVAAGYSVDGALNRDFAVARYWP